MANGLDRNDPVIRQRLVKLMQWYMIRLPDLDIELSRNWRLFPENDLAHLVGGGRAKNVAAGHAAGRDKQGAWWDSSGVKKKQPHSGLETKETPPCRS